MWLKRASRYTSEKLILAWIDLNHKFGYGRCVLGGRLHSWLRSFAPQFAPIKAARSGATTPREVWLRPTCFEESPPALGRDLIKLSYTSPFTTCSCLLWYVRRQYEFQPCRLLRRSPVPSCLAGDWPSHSLRPEPCMPCLAVLARVMPHFCDLRLGLKRP